MLTGAAATIGNATGGKFGFSEEPACAKMCPNLTFKQRVIGFGACFGMGWLLSFIGTMTLIGGPTSNNITTFAVLYVVGNVVALCSTGFLLGPRSQCQKMMHPSRRYSTAFYLICLIITFSIAVAKQNVGAVIFMLLVSVLAALWYSISYIPFARKIIIGYLRRGPLGPCFDAVDQVKASMSEGESSGGNSSGGNGNNGSSGGGFMSKKGFSLLNDDNV